MPQDQTTGEQLARLTERLSNFMEQATAAADKADADRKHMMADISELKDGQRKLSDDMKQVKPITDMVSGIKAKMTGAAIVLGVIGTVAWAGVLFFKDQIIRLLEGSP